MSSLLEETLSIRADANDGLINSTIDDEGITEEITDEEEDLFVALEREKLEENGVELEQRQPKDIQEAPKLLKDSLEKGEVQIEESEQESADGENGDDPAKEKPNHEDATNSASTNHHHRRVSYFDTQKALFDMIELNV